MFDWKGGTKGGWVAVSRMFLRHHRGLGVSDAQAMLILTILDYQWGDRLPFPKVETLAEATGKSEKTVRANIRALRELGLVRTRLRGGRSNEYDFSPLFDRLREIENESTPIPFSGESASPKNGVAHRRNTKMKNTKSDLRALAERAKMKGKGTPQRSVFRTATDLQPGAKVKPEKARSAFSSRDIEVLMRDTAVAHGAIPPMWTMKDRKHAKELISHYGGEAVATVVETVVKDWAVFVQRYRLKGHPSMAFIYGYRNSVFPDVLEGATKERPTWGSHYNPNDNTPSEGEWE